MTSLPHLARTADAETFRAAYAPAHSLRSDGRTDARTETRGDAATDAGTKARGELLHEALLNRDAFARAEIALLLLADGAPATTTREGQSALSLLLGAHRRVGDRDGEVFASLVDAGADVNFRERRGELVAHLVAKARVNSEEQRRPMYEALFGSPDLDLSLPVNLHNPGITMLRWLRGTVERAPHRHVILAEYLRGWDATDAEPATD